MELIDGSVTRFTELLASPAPVPGGGGACALVGAVGIALGDMVGELTVGKKKYADVEADLRALMARAQDLRRRLGYLEADQLRLVWHRLGYRREGRTPADASAAVHFELLELRRLFVCQVHVPDDCVVIALL